jgi:hypothetical protein
VEIQGKMQDQSKAFDDAKGMPNPELWTQFMSGADADDPAR